MILDILKQGFKGALIRIVRIIVYILLIAIVLFLIGYHKQSTSPNIYERRSIYEIIFHKK